MSAASQNLLGLLHLRVEGIGGGDGLAQTLWREQMTTRLRSSILLAARCCARAIPLAWRTKLTKWTTAPC